MDFLLIVSDPFHLASQQNAKTDNADTNFDITEKVSANKSKNLKHNSWRAYCRRKSRRWVDFRPNIMVPTTHPWEQQFRKLFAL